VAERIRNYSGFEPVVSATCTRQLEQGTDRGAPLAFATVRGEVVLSQQQAGRLVHALIIEPASPENHLTTSQRVDLRSVIPHAVGVTTPQRGEPSIETSRCKTDSADAKVIG
jgi:hypothetical protein